MSESFLLLCPIIIALLVVVALLKPRLRTVPEGQRLVILRMGRFNRIAGPGPVWLMERFESVAHTLNVREELAEIRVNSLAFHGNFLGYTFSFWYRTDPAAIAGNDRARLAQLVQFSPEERQVQIRSKLREAVMNSITKLDRESPPPPGASPVQALIPVLPGQPLAERLAAVLTTELETALRSIGVVLSSTHGVKIKEIHPNETLMKNFGRGITVAMLREQMPGVSADTLAQLVAATEQIEMPDVQRIILEHPAGSQPQRAERTSIEEEALRPKPVVDLPPPEPARPLHPEDWRVLKRVPRARSA